VKYVVDVDKIRAIYFNTLISGDMEEMDSVDLKNVRYRFDDLDIRNVEIINKKEKAFILTTDGYVEFHPVAVIQYEEETLYDGLIVSLNYIKKNIDRFKLLEKRLSEMARYPIDIVDTIFTICSGYVCVNRIDNFETLNENNFFAETVYPELKTKVDKKMKISSDDTWWTFDVSKVEKPALLSIRVGKNVYRYLYVEGDCMQIKIRKGTCIFTVKDEKIYCM